MKIHLLTLLVVPGLVSSFVIPRNGPVFVRQSLHESFQSTEAAASLPSEGGSTISAEEQHAREVFAMVDTDNLEGISPRELGDLLTMLGIDADEDECEALFRFLDIDESGKISIDEFLPWYTEAADAAKDSSKTFQSIICNRRTVDQFDRAPVDDDVLERAIQCAITAPNRSGSEPWRFIRLGPKTVEQVSELNRKVSGDEGSFMRWTHIPGWCVVTCPTKPNSTTESDPEDYKSVSCAIQNFMLSMWSEGVGSKWTSGPVQKTPEFAELCGVDLSKEQVVGVIWYGFARGGLQSANPKRRQKTVKDVLASLP